MSNHQNIDSLLVFGRQLSWIRGPSTLLKTPGNISPQSLANAIASSKIVKDGFTGPVGFLTGRTVDGLPEEAQIVHDAFMATFESRPPNPIHIIGGSLDTRQDVALALRFVEENGFKRPGLLSSKNHFHAINKVLPVDFASYLIASEDILSKEELRKISDGRLILEQLAESTVGRILPPGARSFLASIQRPGMRK
jgi:hypothetical protein